MTVNEKEASGKTAYQGQTYYFCSADCQRAFEENPGKFAGLQR
jgi:Cu+-exporting ATPase